MVVAGAGRLLMGAAAHLFGVGADDWTRGRGRGKTFAVCENICNGALSIMSVVLRSFGK